MKVRPVLKAILLAALAAFVVASPLRAQDAETEKAIEKYRQMLREDPWSNPGFLDADRGETLWTTARGPKNASLEQCDLGKGPGQVKGAFVEMPRYFADTKKVQDLESRLLTCMESLQGIPAPRSRRRRSAAASRRTSKRWWPGSRRRRAA